MNPKVRKETGSHYTPPELANYLAEKIVSVPEYNKFEKIEILDPACGDGALLYALTNRITKNNEKRELGIHGVDTNEESLVICKKKIASLTENFDIRCDDFLNIININDESLFSIPKENNFKNINIIIANPPYVRTQVLGSDSSKNLSSRFNLTGRVDLYQVFFAGITNLLSDNGILGIIISNKFLSNLSGESLRNILLTNYKIIEIIDLGDTKMFEAAVLPSIILAVKRKNRNNVINIPFRKIYESINNVNSFSLERDSLVSILSENKSGLFKVNSKLYQYTYGNTETYKHGKNIITMNSNEEIKWKELIDKTCKIRIKDIASVKVGVKSTADKIFVRDDWDNLPSDIKPDESLLKNLITSDVADQWKIDYSKITKKILYPYYSENGKRIVIDLEKYKQSEKYFLHFRETLEKRTYLTESNRKWFEIWVPHNPKDWEQPKIVFPDISPIPKFFIDQNGLIVNGECYWIILKPNIDTDYLYLITGIANSNIISEYHDLSFNNKLYSGRRRYLTQYVANYPLPDINTKSSQQIISNVKKIFNENLNEIEKNDIGQIIENYVAESFNIKL